MNKEFVVVDKYTKKAVMVTADTDKAAFYIFKNNLLTTNSEDVCKYCQTKYVKDTHVETYVSRHIEVYEYTKIHLWK